jgi:predicted nuclease of predicted toxin-antitoxin system
MTTFIADESVDRQVVLALRAEYEVLYIAEENPGITDEQVLSLCANRKAVLITADKDFGELVFRFKKNHSGVVLCRFPGISPLQKAALVLEIFKKHVDELKDNFTVITKDRMRIRKPFGN